MSNYYSSIIILLLLSLAVLCILVWENNRISKEDKRLMYLTYFLLALSAAAEWTGLRLNGRENIPKAALVTVKTIDYILTPMAGGAIIGQVKIKNRWNVTLMRLILFNTLFQILAAFTGGMLSIDDHHVYSHGPLYIIYILIYLSILMIVIVQFLLYGRSFSRHNRKSIYAIMIFIVTGIAIQEVMGGEYRTAYLALTIGAILIFIH